MLDVADRVVELSDRSFVGVTGGMTSSQSGPSAGRFVDCAAARRLIHIASAP